MYLSKLSSCLFSSQNSKTLLQFVQRNAALLSSTYLFAPAWRCQEPTEADKCNDFILKKDIIHLRLCKNSPHFTIFCNNVCVGMSKCYLRFPAIPIDKPWRHPTTIFDLASRISRQFLTSINFFLPSPSAHPNDTPARTAINDPTI